YNIILTVSDGQNPPATDTDTVTITVSEEVVVIPPDEPDLSSLRNGLVGEWLFSDSDGSVARDTSGNSNNVTLSDETMWADDNCLDFSSTETYLTAEPTEALNLSGSLTISAWINPRTFGQSNYGRIVDKGDGSASRGFSLLLNGSNADVGYLTYGGDYVSSTDNVISLNTWTHVCATYDTQAQTVSFYVDGQPAGSAAYTQDPASTAGDPLYIGLRGYSANRNFDGQIDGVRLYSRSVDAAEALMLYQAGRGGDLVGQWKLDEKTKLDAFTGQTASDASEYGNEATLVNNPIWGAGWANEDFLHFSGNHEALQIPTYGWNKEEGTISMWVTPESADSFQFLFGHMLNSTNRIFIYTNAGKLALGLGDSSAISTNIATLDPDQPYHVALTWQDTTYALCLDGEKVDEGTFSGFTAFNTFADIGNYGDETIRDNYNLSWDGTVDEVSIYRRALQDEEIYRLCNTHEAKDNDDFVMTLGGSTNYNASQLPEGATFDFDTQTLKWRPGFDQAGDHVILFISQDGLDRHTITISVQEKPKMPWYEEFLKFKGVK
ncbi:MAG: LamG domain-containing protein, partial [Planctomycetota bacterium]